MSGTPHRQHAFIELCVRCKEPAGERCLRCGAPLCGEHAPADEARRCDDCEEAYAARTAWLRGAAEGRIYATFGRPMVVFLSVFLVSLPLSLAGIHWGLAALGCSSMLALSVRWYRRTPPRWLAARSKLRRARKRFLAKRAPRALPPARATGEGE